MTAVNGVPAVSAQAPSSDDAARLKEACGQLEGVFMVELMKAMRATVSKDGVLPAGGGEEMFTGMLDQQIAESASVKGGGIADALFAQLGRALRQP
jgi:flagellar protein FlgJ